MNVHAIGHEAITGCYAYDQNTLMVNPKTDKDITAVYLHANDPYVGENRMVDYEWKNLQGKYMRVCLNASETNADISLDKPIVYSRLLDGNTLLPGGIAVVMR